jgi:RNA recognition motif-containing protein
MGVEEKPEEEVKLSPTTIFINGLPPTFSNDDLKTHFDKFGAWKKGEGRDDHCDR